MRVNNIFKSAPIVACIAYFLGTALLFSFFLTSALAALDAPHNDINSIGCDSCHAITSSVPNLLPPLDPAPLPSEIDTTAANVLCISCHNPLGQAPDADVVTHSSLETDNSHGNWTVECWVCHNQHKQEQDRDNGSSHGMFIRSEIDLEDIKLYDNLFNPRSDSEKTGRRTVIFTGRTGTHSFGDGDANIDGICEVCHTQTTHWKNDGTLAAVGVHQGLEGSNCLDCHPHSEGFKLSYTDHSPIINTVADCQVCHSGPDVIGDIHRFNCNTCHDLPGFKPLGGRLPGDLGAYTLPLDCLGCHSTNHGTTIAAVTSVHQLSSDSSGGYDCEACHNSDVANEQLNTHMGGIDTPAQCALICHNNTTPSNTSGIIAKTVIDDVTFNDPAPNLNNSRCENCHDAKGDFRLHGLSDDDSVADGIDDGTGGVVFHDNLGSSRGSWADSGGTIPTTQAAGYTGKIDTANALVDDDYNCADCHAVDRASFSSLEAMRVHTFIQGTGSGNCLTCHGAPMVDDEINAGKGAAGTTIECEDCHSIANGNGPSGKEMYQYDGKRHHGTMHAQTGNCTRCHADPRPADLSAEPGYAGTAAINDGSDGDGMTWNDGFDDDFNINYTHPGGMPTQMGCRLCHTNYQTYNVDVKAEIDADWDTDEISDHHGYNKPTNPDYSTSGLTIYTNDFDARNTSLTYLDPLVEGDIRGTAQTTQVSIPSHRIESLNGSKINVYNYGACFSCHTVQIRHAAPIPAQDYDTPVADYDTAAMNTYPYDTLRYAPGRSVFNDFKGSGLNGDAWNNHTKDIGSFPYWLDDWTKRPSTVFRPGPDFFGDIADDSLVAVPVTANVNDLESLPGMSGPYTIRNFDTGPNAPDFDEITITVAQWTGSVVYVEAFSSIGSGQNFTFTYTGAGGPCNTTMAWNTDHYEGTCVAASGYNGTDTVTVHNNTTSAPDEKTRSLTDLTINPSTPLLTSIAMSDKNSADPAPAETGFTNNHSVAVTLTATNYPTHVMFSEDADFIANSGWLLFDATVNYTLEDLGPPPSGEGTRTLYARVKNDAGESGTQSNTIVLDTVDPAILADTLTAPNGHAEGWQSEFWDVGSNQTITWNAGDISDVNLKANPIFIKESYDSGNTWRVLYIAQNEVNDGSYNWPVPGSPITSSRIRLEARDKAGNVATDASDNDYNKSTPYIVTNTSDSGAGSLRQVLTDLIAAGGNHSLWFNIPDTDTDFIDGVAIISPATNLPTINRDDIYIEGGTQTALRGDTNSRGPEIRINKAGTSTTGFTISGGVFNHIRKLQITGFTTGVSSTGSDTVLEGNHFGFSSGNTAGYTSVPNDTGALLSDDFPVIEQNFFACASTTGVDLTNSSSATVGGNVFGLFPDPTDPDFPASPAHKCYVTANLAIGNDAVLVGGSANGVAISNNIISGSNRGIYLGGSSSNTTITGNQIGTFYDSNDGWVAAAGSGTGIYLDTTGGGNVIGGTNVATADDNLNDSNVIAPFNPDLFQSYRTGIHINTALNYSTWIYGNFIGTNPECDPVNDRGACEVFRGTVGINIYFAEGVTIGGDVGTDPPCQAGNVIANMNGNGGSSFGVKVSFTPSKYVKLHCNTFFDNGDGAADDAFHTIYAPTPTRPVIIAADTTTVRVSNIWGGNGTTQQGNIVEVYLADFDGTEYGEGVKLIGLTQAVFGQTSVDVDISGAGVTAGDWVTATRTWHYSGTRYQTSPFSTNLRIPGTTTAPSLNWLGTGNYVADGVHPDSAPVDSSFTFQVEYTDADSDPPQIIELWLDKDDDGNYHDSEKFAMTEVNPADTNYTDGKLYEKVLYLDVWTGWAGDGILNYRFYASDGSFYTVTGDATYPLLDDTNTVEVTN